MNILVGKIQKPKKYYTVTDLVKSRLIPWAKDNRTVVKHIDADRSTSNILQAKITSVAPYRRYLVAHKNLIKYLKIYGPALMATVRKTKSNGNTIKRSKKVSRTRKES